MTAPAPAPPTDVELLRRLVARRFTCRGFRPDPVPEATIRSIVDIARRTPSWCNTQPWQLVITLGAGTDAFRQALLDRVDQTSAVESDLPFPEAYRDVYAERRRETGYQLYAAVGIARGDKVRYAAQARENFRLFGAPHVAILTTRADLGPYGAIDCGGFVSTFLLAAEAHGVATAPQAALASQAGFIREYFALGDDRQLVCGVSFGYADPTHPANGFRTGRADVDEVVRWA